MGRMQRSMAAVCSLAAAALVVAACGTASTTTTTSSGGNKSSTNQASAPGITATSVTLGATEPLTGVAAPGYKEIAPATNAVFEWADAHGGIWGRSVHYSYVDDAYNPSQTVTKTKQLVQQPVFASYGSLGTPTQLQVQAYLNTNKIPQLMVASGCACWNNPTQYPETFGFQTNYIIEGKIIGKYVAQNFSGKKVGYVYQDDEFGQDGVKGLAMSIPSASVASRQPYTIAQLSSPAGLGAQMAAMQAAGAQVVVLYTIPIATAEAVLAASKIGYHPQFVISSVGADITTLNSLLGALTAGKSGISVLNGALAAGYLPAVTDIANPWISLFHKIWLQYDHTNLFDGNTEYGMAAGFAALELLQAAGRNPTRASLVSTLEQHGASFNGPGLAPLAYSSSNHSGYENSQIVEISNGKYVTKSAVYTSTDTGPVVTYTGSGQGSPPSFTDPKF